MSKNEYSYSVNSEIDRAFPYLVSLNEKLKETGKGYYKKDDDKATFFQMLKYYFSKRKYEHIDVNKKYMKSKMFKKDGYTFSLKLHRTVSNNVFDSPYLYEFFVNIRYGNDTIEKQLYKTFKKSDEALNYYFDMLGVFKHLTRRDLMEMIFKEIEKELKQ